MGAGRPTGRAAVFLDRDGVINRNVFNPASGDCEAPLTAADFALVPGAALALRQLRSAGFLLFVVSNQPNYAKGKASVADLAAIDGRMRQELAAAGVVFNGVYYCLHHPEGKVTEFSGPCACRKPSPYFLLRAMREFGVDAEPSWMVGDRATDVLCGRAAGVRTIFLSETGSESAADCVARDLEKAADFICRTAAACCEIKQVSAWSGGRSLPASRPAPRSPLQE